MINEEEELLIQKCVDGELNVTDQQQLLIELDDVAGGWKFLALAFIEEQAWSDSFAQADRAATDTGRLLFDPMIQAPNMAQIDINEEVMCFRPDVQAMQQDQQHASRSRFLTQATCLAIALVGGVLIGDIWRARRGSSATTSTDTAESNTNTKDLGNLSDASRLVDVDLPSIDGGTTQFPARRYKPMPIDQEFNMSPRFSSELRELGFGVTQESQWYRFELDGGEQVLIPLHRRRIAPIGQ